MAFDQEQPRLPANLMAPYLAVAAQEVAEGSDLGVWSRRALNEARLILTMEKSTMERRATAEVRRSGAALQTTTTSTLEFAALALDALRVPTSRACSPADERILKIRQLSELIDLLGSVEAGDNTAARRALEWCDSMLAQLFDRLTPLDF